MCGQPAHGCLHPFNHPCLQQHMPTPRDQLILSFALVAGPRLAEMIGLNVRDTFVPPVSPGPGCPGRPVRPPSARVTGRYGLPGVGCGGSGVARSIGAVPPGWEPRPGNHESLIRRARFDLVQAPRREIRNLAGASRPSPPPDWPVAIPSCGCRGRVNSASCEARSAPSSPPSSTHSTARTRS